MNAKGKTKRKLKISEKMRDIVEEMQLEHPAQNTEDGCYESINIINSPEIVKQGQTMQKPAKDEIICEEVEAMN